MKNFLFLTLLMILIASAAWSFDGNRKGFVLGGGMGFVPTAEVKLDGFDGDGAYNAGIGLNLLIGYAWNEKNMIMYDGNVVGYKPIGTTVDLLQGFSGVSWYHYFGEPGNSLFTVAGVGTYTFEADGFDANDRGGAIMIGGGCEFTRHWQAGVYFSTGKTSDNSFDYKHNHFSLLISGVAF